MTTQPTGRPSSALVGAGDGSVLLLCRDCTPAACLAPSVRDLDRAQALWVEHRTQAHGGTP